MSSKGTPIAVRLPAEPGWCALVIEHDADGKMVKLDAERFKVVAWPVVVWGLVFNCEPMRGFFSLLSGGTDSNAKAIPLGADGERLSSMKGFMGLQYPGETAQEAVDRIEAPAKEAQERGDRERARREAERAAREQATK